MCTAVQAAWLPMNESYVYPRRCRACGKYEQDDTLYPPSELTKCFTTCDKCRSDHADALHAQIAKRVAQDLGLIPDASDPAAPKQLS